MPYKFIEAIMQTLRIAHFSCIKFAEIETADLTILIGPQASGKSVISKLLYFFNEAISDLINSAEEQVSVKDLSAVLGAKFAKWFPPSAWGPKVFQIRFNAGPFEIQVKRARSYKSPSEKVQIKFSEPVLAFYGKILSAYEVAQLELLPDESDLGSKVFEVSYRLRNTAERNLFRELRESYIGYQLFVPAGRSFFTSIGKAVAVFEHGGILDPITLSFGRYYASIRDRLLRLRFADQRDDSSKRRARLMSELFGGEIKVERDKEFIETNDGRKVPFSILSSGQQELLPLWFALTNFSASVRTGTRTNLPPRLIYIEEPEAHLFPTAQSTLMEYLATIPQGDDPKRNMLITTHSPYMLSKINVLLKAGALGGTTSKRTHQRVTDIIPRASWLRAANTRAYAIVEGKVVSILGAEGLIDGEYLDDVSGDIAKDFNRLLEIEFE
jgi:energy-coupling factor transporter ATP-binding protein EcfA2